MKKFFKGVWLKYFHSHEPYIVKDSGIYRSNGFWYRDVSFKCKRCDEEWHFNRWAFARCAGTLVWFFNEGFKVWLEASPQVRAKRVMSRDSMTSEAALEALTKKDERTRQIYKNLYGFDLGNDLNPFDLILSTDDLNPYEVFQAVSLVTDRLVFGR